MPTLADLRRTPNALARHYARFRVAERLLLTGHSHQAWPDVARDGLVESFDDARFLAERPGEEAAGQRTEECPPGGHWMTSSARSSSDCGSVSPRALAALRLITMSNLTGCSTGSSLGFAPFRILST